MEELANRIRQLAWNFDTYEYGDTFSDDDTEALNRIEELLQYKKGIDSLIEFTNDVLDSELQELFKEAKEIKQQLIEQGEKQK